MRKILVTVLFSALGFAACGSSGTKHATNAAATSSTSTTAPAVVIGVRTDAKFGDLLVDAQGMTLYKNVKDKPGAFACTDACLTMWPPLLAPAGARPTTAAALPAALSTVGRPDGATQVTYNGAPLYLFANDHNPGDVNGQGVGGVWSVVSATVASAATTTTGRTVTTARAAAPATTTARPNSTAATAPPPTTPPSTTAPPQTMPTYGY